MSKIDIEYSEEFIAHINTDGKIQSCKEHSLNTAYYAQMRLEQVGLSATAYVAALLHDSGKFTKEFSNYIQKAVAGENVAKGSIIHTFAGCTYLLDKFHDGKLDYKDVTAEVMAFAIAAHHGLFDQISKDGSSGFDHRINKQPDYDRNAMLNFFAECIAESEIKRLFEKAVVEITDKLNSILEMSNENNDEVFFYTGLLARLILSSVIDGDRTDTYLFMSNQAVLVQSEISWNKYIHSLESFLNKKKKTNAIDKARGELSNFCMEFASNPTDVYQLNIPTGAGKTLSSLRYALYHAEKYKKSRIFYIAPLISILEQNVEVIKKAMGDGSIVLEHHSNVIREDEDYEDDGVLENSKLLLDNWNAPIVVTTLVQFLNTLFAGKTSQIRRFSALVNSVVILDEVQSVPWRMLSLFNLSINFLKSICNVTILLCSATQPSFQEIKHSMLISSKTIIPKDKIAGYYSLFRRNEICFGGKYRLDEVPNFIEKIMYTTESLLVICNKKTESEFLFYALEEQNYRIFHLSAAMCMAHREDMMNDLKQALVEHGKVVCIATQVVEAGVDISFQTVVRFEAGIDSIVQAGGRCNRNGEYKQGCKTYIIECVNESLIKLEEIQIAQNATKELIYEYDNDPDSFQNDLSSTEAVEEYYKVLYRYLKSRTGYFEYPLKDMPTIYSLMSDNNAFFRHESKYFMNQALKTAGDNFRPLDDNSFTLLVPYGEGVEIIAELGSEKCKYDLKYAKSILEKAKKYSVSIMAYQIKELYRKNMVYSVYNGAVSVLREEYYDKNTGFTVRKEDGEKCNILIL